MIGLGVRVPLIPDFGQVRTANKIGRPCGLHTKYEQYAFAVTSVGSFAAVDISIGILHFPTISWLILMSFITQDLF